MPASPKFFLAKVLALLVEPHLPWTFLRHQKSPDWLGAAGEAHEALMNDLEGVAKKIGLDWSELEGVASESRRAASYLDRWMLEEGTLDLLREKFPLRRLELKNPVDPRLGHPLPPSLEEGAIYNFYSDIRCAIPTEGDGADAIRDKYLALYSIFELAWIRKGLPIGPYNPYFPIFTTFDHGYASASVVNLLMDPNGDSASGDGEPRPKGRIVLIDVAGVHDFISKSRKLKDVWASSYLVSYLLWRTMEDVIFELGPDVVLKPALRSNPFFYHSLLLRLNGTLRRIVEEQASGILKFHRVRDFGFPFYSTLPESALLLLPAGTRYDDEHFERAFKKAWSDLYHALSSEQPCSGGGAVSKILKKASRILSDYSKGFGDNPPLEVRVISINVESIWNDNGGEPMSFLQFWREALTRLYEKELAGSKMVRREPESNIYVLGMTRDAINERLRSPKTRFPPSGTASSKGFHYCTVCGKMPAVLRFGVGESYEEDVRELIGEEVGSIESVKKIFSEGEKLCPWCLAKRLFGNSPVDALREVGFVLEEDRRKEEPLIFPSLSEISSADYLEAAIRRLEESEDFREFVRGVGRRRGIEEPGGRRFAWLFKESMRLKSPGSCSFEAKVLLDLDPELEYMGDRAEEWMRYLDEPPATYVAIIKSDGDNLGKTFSGELQVDPPGVPLEEWLRNAAIGPLREVISKLLGGEDSNSVASWLFEELGLTEGGEGEEGEARERIGRLVEDLDRVVREVRKSRKSRRVRKSERLLPSLSYAKTLSAALMRNSALDVMVIESMRGFVIYAGGEDVLAVTPAADALRAVVNSRRTFMPTPPSDLPLRVEDYEEILEGSSGPPGFYMPAMECFDSGKPVTAIYPHLAPLGRSYSVYLTHYRYPMSWALSSAEENLERAKEVEWRGRGPMRKDSLIVVYSARGYEREAMLPLSLSRPIWTESSLIGRHVSLIDEILRAIESDRTPAAPVYRVVRDSLIELLAEAGEEELFRSIVSGEFGDDGGRVDKLMSALWGVRGEVRGEKVREAALAALDTILLVLSAARGRGG